ncbi:MAG TPA: hypothetical protein VKZ69_11790 [Limnochordales bacterium]|nr:hypothetical protein [Limnochordales bacterium]
MRRLTWMLTVTAMIAALLMGASMPALAQWFGGGEDDPRQAAVASLESVRDALAAPAAADLDPGAVPGYAVDVLALIEGENGAVARLEDVAGRSADEFAGSDLTAILEAAEEPAEVLALVHVLAAQQRLEAAAEAADLQDALYHVEQALGLLSE